MFRTNVLHCDSKQILTVRDNDQISLSNHYEWPAATDQTLVTGDDASLIVINSIYWWTLNYWQSVFYRQTLRMNDLQWRMISMICDGRPRRSRWKISMTKSQWMIWWYATSMNSWVRIIRWCKTSTIIEDWMVAYTNWFSWRDLFWFGHLTMKGRLIWCLNRLA